MRAVSKDEAWKWAKQAHAMLKSEGLPLTVQSFRRALRRLDAPIKSEIPLNSLFGRWVDVIRRLEETYVSPEVEVHAVNRETMTPEEAWAVMSKAADDYVSAKHESAYHTYEIKEKGPVGIILGGDLHIGSVATDYNRLDWVATQLERKDLPIYFLQIGDYMDNMFWLAEEVAKNGKVSTHVKAATAWTRRIAPKLVGLCGGNHDAWTKRNVGVDILDHVFAKAGVKIPYNPVEMVLDLVLGKVDYRFVLRHQCPGKSQDWPAHGALRWLLRHDTHHDADAVVCGHTHSSDHVSRMLHGKRRHGFQLGAYKRYDGDDYAKVKGFPDTNESPDMFAILYSETKKIDVFKDTEQGIWVLEKLKCSQKKSRKRS